MNVSSHKCQLSIKREEKKVFPSKVVKGTLSQTEHKGNSNAIAQWTVCSQCLSFCKASPSVSLPRSGMCWKGLLKSLVQCPHHRSEAIEAQSHGKWWLGCNRSSPSLTDFSIDEHTSLGIVRIRFYLRQRLANFSVKDQIVNSLGLQATGSLLQLLNSAVAVTEKLP